MAKNDHFWTKNTQNPRPLRDWQGQNSKVSGLGRATKKRREEHFRDQKLRA